VFEKLGDVVQKLHQADSLKNFEFNKYVILRRVIVKKKLSLFGLILVLMLELTAIGTGRWKRFKELCVGISK